MLGREVHQPTSLAFGFPGSDSCPVSPVECVTDLWNKMSEIQVYVRKHLWIAAERQKRYYDTRISSKHIVLVIWFIIWIVTVKLDLARS